MKKSIAGVLTTVLLLAAATPALADGGFFVMQEYYDVYQPSQRALILYENNREVLILSVRYEGDADEFAWVIPVPNQPDIGVSDPGLFWELYDLTKIETPPGGFHFAPGVEGPGVEVIETEVVGPYEVTTLSAEDPTALVDWLNSNGYFFPEEGEEIVNDYIDKGWYFVATRINTGEPAIGLAEGAIAPLILSFESDEIVYPLRITSLSSTWPEVLLYVCADQKVVSKEYQFLSLNVPEQVVSLERAGNIFYIEFGEQITVEDLFFYEILQELLSTSLAGDEYYLTKLRGRISADKMVDIELVRYEEEDYLDSDGDGWSDAEEAIAGTDPNEVDTDGDKMWDPEDPYPLEAEGPPGALIAIIIIVLLVIGFYIWRRRRRRVLSAS